MTQNSLIASSRGKMPIASVAAVMVLLALYVPIGLYLEAHFVPMDKTILNPPFARLAGNAFAIYKLPAPAPADTLDESRRSHVVLTEDGKLLGPSHSPHSDINTIGLGRYSYWSEAGRVPVVVFSTSDNSNPNSNGRVYRLLDPDAPYEAQLKH
ncbi:hypothetical protein XH86_19830 [Bradyrhizobium guangdongense]|uniref:Uncharacterized protein n=2 Tax=Bradyrhizobium guangdongense TaxID=1325090 RepID=A0ABX6UHC2_9BRAD|nr:hypothetical protein X265_19805 [Bradyrhizobium guangdongense]QOZ60721.1 hypothetical protein XH86_19830 [Bradyrhizobium guangdongense]